MLYRRVMVGLLSAAVSAALCFGAAAQDTVNLELKFKEGQRLVYRFGATADITFTLEGFMPLPPVMAGPGPMQGKLSAQVNLEALEVEPDGSAWLKTSVGPAAASFEGGGTTTAMSLNEGRIVMKSGDKEFVSPMPAIPPSVEMKMSKRGTILGLRGKGVDEVTSRVKEMGGLDLDQILQTLVFALPDEPLRLGEELKKKSEVKLPGGQMPIPVEYSFVLLGFERGEGNRARVGFTMKASAPQIDMGALAPRVPPRASAPAIGLKLSAAHTMKGEMIFDLDMGQVRSSTFEIRDEFSMSGAPSDQAGDGKITAFKGTLALNIKGAVVLVEPPKVAVIEQSLRAGA